MKKFFLIPLMTLVCSVMAWGATVEVGTFEQLKAAIDGASNGDVIKLTADINYGTAGGANYLNITKSITLDGQGHTLTGACKRASADFWATLFVNEKAEDVAMMDIVIKDITLVNNKQTSAYGASIRFQHNINTAILTNVVMDITGGVRGNSAPMFLGGSDTNNPTYTLNNCKLLGKDSDYPYYSWIKAHIIAEDTYFSGYCGMYFKEGSFGTIVDATACQFDAPNVHSGLSNAFSVFAFEDGGIKMTLTNCGMNAEQIGDQSQRLLDIRYSIPLASRNVDVVDFILDGDNSHFNAAWSNQFNNPVLNQIIFTPSGTPYVAENMPKVKMTIKGGTYSFDPSSIGWYDSWVLENEEVTGNVNIATATIPENYEVQEIKQGDVTLYRVVKKAASYVDPVTSETVLYDLNAAVETTAEGENPVTSFDLSTGTEMKLDEDREVTTAGYVQVKDNGSSQATVVKVGTTATADPTQKVDQTLVINNGLDVQGESQVIVQAGSTLIVGEGGINTEDPENIVLNVTEDEGASLLLDPTITINKNPNLTVKLTTNSKQLTASPWTYVYQRFAIPVQVGVVPANDFDGELFPGNTSFKNYVFEWNGYDWVACSNWGALEPFKGYQLANNSKKGGVTYTFTGQLVGNDNSVYNFPTGGFDFFGNSHLAPIYIDSLLKPYEDQAVEASVWLYNYESKNFEAITSEDIADGWAFATEIKPMEGFILNYHGTTGSAGMNYASAIWGNPKFDAAIGRPSQSNPAPARNRVSETSNRAIINVVAENGQGDNVKLVEKEKYSAEFENGADASKFVYDNAVSIYASTENSELSRVATNDLTGTLLSFNSNDATNYTITLSNVLGEDYALRDNVTGQTIAFAEGATYTFTQAANTTVPARFEVVSAAKMPTALDNVEEAAKVSGIYTITGQYLGHDFTNLPAGVYIVNGVKIVK